MSTKKLESLIPSPKNKTLIQMNHQILSTDFSVDDGEEEEYTGFSSNEETDDESDKGEWDKKTNYGNQKIVF